jgi:hypothetical protein
VPSGFGAFHGILGSDCAAVRAAVLEPEEPFPDSKNRLLSTMLCSGRAVHTMNPHAVFGINLADLPPGTH